ncbi:hypothetical protein [Phenylobacterium sp. J426]|nr:hypothetical protein [Phenylobacterium sp. J426]
MNDDQFTPCKQLPEHRQIGVQGEEAVEPSPLDGVGEGFWT